MADVNYIFFLSLTIILLGFIIKKLNLITQENGRVIAKLIINVTLPALILSVVTNIKINITLILLPFICFGFNLIVVTFSAIIFRNKKKELKGAILMAVIGFNIGLFAYPIIEGIWGAQGLIYIAMFDVGNAFIIFAISYSIGSYFSRKKAEELKDVSQIFRFKIILFSLLKSAPLMAYIIALILNAISFQFPVFISDVLDIIARANYALTLLLLGIYLNFKFKKEQWASILKVLIIRYSFGLVIGLTLFFILPFSLLYRGIILIGLILPIGMAVIPFSAEFEYDEKLVGMMVNLSLIISFILMWFFIVFFGIS
jgi:hypothetical protein